MEQKFAELVQSSQNIVVTSHISPDPDAVASSLLLAETLKLNFPDKKITLALEDQPAQNLNFLHGFGDIVFGPLVTTVESTQPDLFIITDADDYDRVSRTEGQKLHDYLVQHAVPVAVIDHHAPDEHSIQTNVINRRGPAAAQEVYHLCFMVLNWQKPEDYATTTLLGIIIDTVRFRYENPLHRETFEIVNDLLDAGADIQRLEDRIDRYTDAQMEVLAELLSHTTHENDYSYSFVSDEFFKSFMDAGKPYAEMKSILGMFGDEFIRKIGERRWGFTVYQDPTVPDTYKVSFRAITGAKNVQEIAVKLGGGGHIPAAAATIKAKTISEALIIVAKAIQ